MFKFSCLLQEIIKVYKTPHIYVKVNCHRQYASAIDEIFVLPHRQPFRSGHRTMSPADAVYIYVQKIRRARAAITYRAAVRPGVKPENISGMRNTTAVIYSLDSPKQLQHCKSLCIYTVYKVARKNVD